MSIAIVPGSFDPMTVGHRYIVTEALKQFDCVVVAIMVNPEKKYLFSLEERVEIAKKTVEDLPNVTVVWDDGLLVNLYDRLHADAVCKGIRSEEDTAYEKVQEEWNLAHRPGFRTVYIPTTGELSQVSSTLVKENPKEGLKFVYPSAKELVQKKLK